MWCNSLICYFIFLLKEKRKIIIHIGFLVYVVCPHCVYEYLFSKGGPCSHLKRFINFTGYSVYWLLIPPFCMHYLDIGSQNNVHLIPSYSVTINRLPSLQPAVCTYFIRSLLLFADVQTFCSEKESLFVTLESFKERETTQSLPVSPSVTIQPTKQTDPYLHVMQSTSNAGAVYSAHLWFCCYSWLFKQKSWKLCVLMLISVVDRYQHPGRKRWGWNKSHAFWFLCLEMNVSPFVYFMFKEYTNMCENCNLGVKYYDNLLYYKTIISPNFN